MPAQPEPTQVERDKLTIDPDFDFKNDIACRDLADTTPNEMAMFKWTGIYPQLQKGSFMMRIRIPGGLLTADQLGRIADIGLRGRRTTTDTGSEEGFEICIGGGLDGPGHIARPVCEVATAGLAPAVRRILEIYLEGRRDDAETFGTFARRVGTEAISARLGVPAVRGTAANQTNLKLQPVFDEAVAWES
ncbi:MAG: hypothetical protein BWK77_05945 [Verrucomicrobia bacterium A1]|nr:MAG: hypothetical protein BWK77_05945 [Verrucomicrobia bacterium A1]